MQDYVKYFIDEPLVEAIEPRYMPRVAEFARLIDQGTLRVVLDSTYPLADARRRTSEQRRGMFRARMC